MMPRRQVYLDHAATTPVSIRMLLQENAQVAGNAFREKSFQPPFLWPRCKQHLEVCAGRGLLRLSGGDRQEVVFTSGVQRRTTWLVMGNRPVI